MPRLPVNLCRELHSKTPIIETLKMTRLLAILSLSLTLALLFGTPVSAAPPAKGDLVPGQYLVVLKKTGTFGGLLSPADIAKFANQLADKYGGTLLLTYGNALNGYLVKLDAKQAAALGKDPLVKYIEQDSFVATVRTQTKAPWGLDRIDQRKPSLDGDFRYPESAGEGVRVYVIDTGVRGGHNEFKGRYAGGVNFVSSDYNPANGKAGDVPDCNGHGTHVAGTAVGERYGVAKRAKLYSVRVLDCEGSGTMAGVVAGVDWVAKNARRPAVANLSLGGGTSRALDDALNKLIDQGVVTVVAAGNDDRDACGVSPARVPDAITVAASDPKDRRASFSNFGKCVDVFAPGTDIQSAWFERDTQNATISGTSMAAPHVAGLAALYLGNQRDARVRQVTQDVVRDSSRDHITDEKGSPNRLAYTGGATDGRDGEQPGNNNPQEQNGFPLPRLPVERLPISR